MKPTGPKFIARADIGTVLKDKEGDVWVRIRGGALVFVHSMSWEHSFGFWKTGSLPKAEKRYGPFNCFDPAKLADRDDEEDEEDDL